MEEKQTQNTAQEVQPELRVQRVYQGFKVELPLPNESYWLAYFAERYMQDNPGIVRLVELRRTPCASEFTSAKYEAAHSEYLNVFDNEWEQEVIIGLMDAPATIKKDSLEARAFKLLLEAEQKESIRN